MGNCADVAPPPAVAPAPASPSSAPAPASASAETTGPLWLPADLPATPAPGLIAKLQKDAAAGNVEAEATLGVCYQGARGVPDDDAQAAHWYAPAAEAGHIGALTNLAQLFDLGAGVPQDHAKAKELYLAAAQKGFAEAQYQVALHFAAGKSIVTDWPQARQWYEKAAAQGHLQAMTNLGNMYLVGHGVPQDVKTARDYLQKPAEAGIVEAQFGLGSSYMSQGNYPAAAPWIRKAAEGGNAGAQFYWAVFLQYGKTGARDSVQAAVWARKAVQNLPSTNASMVGQAHALLALILLDQPGEKNNIEAFQQASVAALAGNAEGEYALAKCFASGFGTTKDLTTAIKWYLSAAKHKEPRAAAALGRYYEQGEGVKQNPAEAFKWYKAGAEAGDATAQYGLARCYRDGIGVERNPEEALKWMHLAAKGAPNAAEITAALAQLEGQSHHGEAEEAFQRGASLAREARRAGGSLDEAVKALTAAANLGHPLATVALSRMYRQGDGVPKDEARADALAAKVEMNANAAVQFQLGLSFMPPVNQAPVEKNIDRAIGYLKRAVDQGHPAAPGPLGFCYMTASPAHQDLVAAFQWLSLAVARGDQTSQMYLERLRPHLTSEQTQEAVRRLNELRPRTASGIPIGPAASGSGTWNNP